MVYWVRTNYYNMLTNLENMLPYAEQFEPKATNMLTSLVHMLCYPDKFGPNDIICWEVWIKWIIMLTLLDQMIHHAHIFFIQYSVMLTSVNQLEHTISINISCHHSGWSDGKTRGGVICQFISWIPLAGRYQIDSSIYCWMDGWQCGSRVGHRTKTIKIDLTMSISSIFVLARALCQGIH